MTWVCPNADSPIPATVVDVNLRTYRQRFGIAYAQSALSELKLQGNQGLEVN